MSRFTARLLVSAGAVALVLYPLVRLVIEAGDATGSASLRDGSLIGPMAGSLLTSAAAAALATTGGAAAALATERRALPGRRALRVAFLSPLLVPPFVSAVGWQAAYAPTGLVDDLLGIGAGWLEGPIGIVLVVAINALPLAYLPIAASLATAGERDMVWAARSSGASGWGAFRTITLPTVRPAVTAGAALTFVSGMNAFGVPIVLGTPSGFGTMTTEIFTGLRRAFSVEAFQEALLLAVALALVTTVVGLSADLSSSTRPLATTRGFAVPARRRSDGWTAAASWTGFALAVGIPFGALLLRAVTSAVGLPPSPANWTLAHLAGALGPAARTALGRSALLAVAAASVVLVLAGGSAWMRRSGSAMTGRIALLGFAVPGSALAVAVFLAYRRPLGAGVALILVAYLGKFWALGHQTLDVSAGRMGADVWRAARASGARPADALVSTVVPILGPALLTAWATVFLFAVHELTMSSLLHGAGSATMAVVVLDLQQTGDPMATAALAVVLTVVVTAAAAPVAVARHAWRRRTSP
jgi:iron(III) transport system permease protein